MAGLLDKYRLMYVIKHNSLLKSSVIELGSFFWRILGCFVKTDENTILFVSNGGNSMSGSPYEIYKYIKENIPGNKYRFIWALKTAEKPTDHEIVKFDSFKYYLTALKAKYWVTDNNIDRGMKFKKKNTVYLNTWHGVAIKKIGNDDKYSGKYDYSYLNYICVSGKHDKRVFTSALKVRENAFLECGMPRNDRLFTAGPKDNERIRKKLNIPVEKKVILYAPTWRDSTNKGRTYDLKPPVSFSKWKKELGDNYVILFRAHDRTTKVMDVKFDDFVMNYSSYESLNDLLIIADILITDYSSVVFDFAILNKPFFCFGYDFEEYYRERGFYFDPKEIFSDGIYRNEDSLLSAVKNINSKNQIKNRRRIFERYMNYSKGNATEICVKKLLEN